MSDAVQPPSAPPSVTGADGTWDVSLEVFEGPLDLLLHLVRRHELDILDIPISFICEKYLEYLAFMQAMDLEVAGDYLVMAATLAWLKSRELLPRPEETAEEDEGEDDGVDPREELVRRLLEYQKFQDAAARIDALPVTGRDVFPRGQQVDLPPFDPGLAPITLFRLAEAFHRVLGQAKIRKSHEVVLERVSVTTRMEQLTLLLTEAPVVEFESMFLGQEWGSEEELRAMLVVTLMSILEMVKLGVVRVHQPAESETLRIERRVEPQELGQVVSTFTERGDDGMGDWTPEPAGEADASTRAPGDEPGASAATPTSDTGRGASGASAPAAATTNRESTSEDGESEA